MVMLCCYFDSISANPSGSTRSKSSSKSGRETNQRNKLEESEDKGTTDDEDCVKANSAKTRCLDIVKGFDEKGDGRSSEQNGRSQGVLKAGIRE